MPINLSVGGKTATNPEMEAAIQNAEAEYQQTQEAKAPAVIEQTTESPLLADPTDVSPVDQLLGEINRQPAQQALINNHGWTNQEVMSSPTKYDAIQRELREATGDIEAVPQFDLDDQAGSGPLGQRIGGPGVTAEQTAAIQGSKALQQDLGTLTDEEIQTKHKFELSQRSLDAGKTHTDVISGYKQMSTMVDKNVQRLTTNMNSMGKAAFEQEIANSLKQEGYNPSLGTVSKVINGLVTNRAYAVQQGIPRAFSDIIMAAHLTAGKKAHTMMLQKEEDALAGNLETAGADEALSLSTATDPDTGRMVNEAMGLEADNETNAIMGAIARKVVGDTLGVKALGDGALFAETRRAVAEKGDVAYTKEYNAQDITGRGLEAYYQLEPIIEKILPAAHKEPRLFPKSTQAELSKPRKATSDRASKDPTKGYGNFDAMNEFIDEQENTPASFNMDVSDPLSSGAFINKYRSERIMGDMFKYEYDAEGNFKEFDGVDPKTGQDLSYIPNKTRKSSIEKELDYLNRIGTTPVFFDYFPGGNNRVYVDATVGNWQSQKLPRAILQSAGKITYDLRKTEVRDDLKAGIMKKLGKIGNVHFDKRQVDVGAKAFDVYAPQWSHLMEQEANGNVDAAHKIMQFAKDGEGLAGIDAILEAVKLHRALQALNTSGLGVRPGTQSNITGSVYTTKFLTEVDGVANGVGHSAMQGGSQVGKINRATNIYTVDDLRRLANGEIFEDTYEITATAMTAMLENHPDGNLGRLILNSGIVDRQMGKKPMMTFGYGAGKDTIKAGVETAVDEWFRHDPEALKKITDNSDATLEEIQELIGSTAWESVSLEFASIKIVNDTMRDLVNAAAKSSILPDLIIPTHGGHNVVLGMKETEIDTEAYDGKRPRVEYKDGSPKGISVEARARKRTTDAYGYGDGGKLKAASQAGVLGIHALDAINLMKTWKEMSQRARKKNARGFANAFQVFDGILMPRSKLVNGLSN